MYYDDLTAFLDWFVKNRPIAPPAVAPMYEYKGKNSAVLFRQAPYQVELMVETPNIEIPDHTHPNMDSYEVFLAGDIRFRMHGKWVDTPERVAQVDKETGVHKLLGAPIRVRPTDSHGATIGPGGGTFLSVQKWINGVEPSSVGWDWIDTATGSTSNDLVIKFDPVNLDKLVYV